MKQRKKKFLIRFTEVEKRLARSKINQYRANILKEIEAISYHFNFLDLKNNTDIITRIIAYKEVVEQLMKIINITESTTFFDVLMLFKNIDLNADNSIQALDRWKNIFQKEADQYLELGNPVSRLFKSTSEAWENKIKKSIAGKLLILRNEYVAKAQEIVSESVQNIIGKRKSRVSKKINQISVKKKELNEIENSLLNMAERISIEYVIKESHCKVNVTAPIKNIMNRLRFAGFAHPIKNKASGNTKFQHLNDVEIIEKFNSSIYGLLHWFSGAGNFFKVKGLAMLLRKSCVLTLANKHKKSIFWVYNTYGSNIQILTGPNSNVNLITRHQIINFKSGFYFKVNCLGINTFL